jgi:S-adenosylmethionine decarboxylase
MLDCAGCNDNIKSRDEIYNFSKTMVSRIDMTAHGEPLIEYLLPGDANQGFSLVQLITTSNICAHFVESNSTAYIDVFSCKPFDVNQAREVVKEFFDPERIKMNFITRHAE